MDVRNIRAKVGEYILVRKYETTNVECIWEVQHTPGLKIIADRYRLPVVAGGYHTWTIMVQGEGSQTFYGVCRQPINDKVVDSYFMLLLEAVAS